MSAIPDVGYSSTGGESFDIISLFVESLTPFPGFSAGSSTRSWSASSLEEPGSFFPSSPFSTILPSSLPFFDSSVSSAACATSELRNSSFSYGLGEASSSLGSVGFDVLCFLLCFLLRLFFLTMV